MTDSLSKTCEYCGKVFYQKNTQQTRKSFMTRKYCCVSCSNRAREQKRKANNIVIPKDRSWVYPKICPQCGEEFLPHDYEWRALFNKRKFCSHKCAYESRRDCKIYVKTCLVCGTTYEKPKKQSAPSFSGRKYCSHKCAIIARYGKTTKTKPRYNKTKNTHSFAIYVNNM